MSNFLLSIFIIAAIATQINAQNDTSSVYFIEMKQRLENSFNYTIELAEKMPEEHYNFKPHPEMMSFTEQLLHIITNVDWLNSDYFNNEILEDEIVGNLFTKAEILDLLKQAKEKSLAVYSSISPNQLNDEVRFFAGPKTKRQILSLISDHMTHHKGQLVVYLRLKDIVPPAYRGW